MKIDLHVHSKYSTRPSQWVLQKLGCPESFTDPAQVYKIAKERGMSLVTITDHNSISGALEIAHLPGTFVGMEATSYFPEDNCKVHVLVYNIDERRYEDIQKARPNVFDLVEYLQKEGIVHVLAHPLYSVNDRLTVQHFEKMLLLFKNFELNGARDEWQNQILRTILDGLAPEIIAELADRHGIEPRFPEPWKKNLVAGSDDHSSLNVARNFTQVAGAGGLDEFFAGVLNGGSRTHGKASTPLTLSHNLYGIAYQFYKHRFDLDRHLQWDRLLRFLDRILHGKVDQEPGMLSKLYYYWNYRKKPKTGGKAGSIQQVLRREGHKLLADDPKLMKLVGGRNGSGVELEQKWFEFVNQISNRVLLHFGDHLMGHLSGGNIFNIFSTIGSAGTLYSMLAPYFVSFSLFAKDRQLTKRIAARFGRVGGVRTDVSQARIAHFTDTFYEVNGVALTLQQQLQLARKTGKEYSVITCDVKEHDEQAGVCNFTPIATYELPEYPEQKLFSPPFLEILNYCFENQFTHINTATPGPIGLAALGAAKILKLPISGTYHTSLPQYARYLTKDYLIEDLMWKYVVWYYDQLKVVYVPSKSTGDELISKGISPQKIRVIPRGIDIERFHPSRKDPEFIRKYVEPDRIKLLYVGRISKEKNLHLLAEVFRTLATRMDNLSLILAGDGPYMEGMKKELKGLPCIFTGYLKGEPLARLYASCDLFVFPSTTDTFGNVVLEAQASGIPVVVTDLGGPQENVIQGKTGIVVRGDDGTALLEGLNGLIRNPLRLREMGKAARKYMEDRSFEQAFDETWEMYQGRFPEVQADEPPVFAEAV